MSENKISINDLFEGLQKQMVCRLTTNRDFIIHPGTKGDSLENVWIEWLRTYLPNRYNVDKAIVIDSDGNLSDQIDLVIYDQQYTPFVFNQNETLYIPAEGVYAVFEVKPDLSGNTFIQGESLSFIEYAGRKVESVRKLNRTSAKILDRGKAREPRNLTKIVGGILTTENSYKKDDTVSNHFQSLSGLKTLDMGCSVNKGSFFIKYDEDQGESDIYRFYETRVFSRIKQSKEKDSLIHFFLQLSRYLQQVIGTVAAVDFNAYSEKIGLELE